ncbi:excalibur calcium-binding domain-containing protein [Streptomyces sp. NPDC058221]|uniref:excalibur calcium-binding domain-containing protein n=1 Tax=Streptomyces sp. NPDC058221 TaxID=3346388 RepID=UPI0036E382CB
MAPAPSGNRPGWTRKRIIIPAAIVLLFIGVGIGGASDDGTRTEKAADAKAVPAATVTATESADPLPAVTETVTATPKPVPAVTKTKTVRVTVAPDTGGSDDSSSSGGSGTSGSSGSDGGNDSAYYANCSAVRAAGAAPIHAGEPGYGRHLDRDGDGVACE